MGTFLLILGGWLSAIVLALLWNHGAHRKPSKPSYTGQVRQPHEEYVDDMVGVHERNAICDVACVMHNPSAGPHRDLTLHWRGDRGIFERICAHGIGHPDPDQFPYWDSLGDTAQAVHGCDGCCYTWRPASG